MMPALAWSLLLVLAASSAFAADVRVTYLVDGKALKAGAPAGTPLTFELHTTSACGAPVATTTVDVENVTLLAHLKAASVKSGPKPPKSVLEMRHVLSGVTPASAFWLKVTGAGVTPVGGACQLQYASVGGITAVAPPASCPPDSVVAGTTCVDKYEASLWDIPPSATTVIQKVKDGTVTLADLAGAGATQLGCPIDGMPLPPPTFPPTGHYTAPAYAASVAGVLPSACISMVQGQISCQLSDKHLLTNKEWAAGAAGTPNHTSDDGSTTCNTIYTYYPLHVGTRASCVSTAGAYDMVGNLWEWTIGDDDKIAWWRGGAYGEDITASTAMGFTNHHPNGQHEFVGFRCGR